MSNGPIATLSAVGVTPTRPETVVARLPVKPGVTLKVWEPLALAAPWTSAGAATGTGRSAIGERTLCPAPVQVSEPLAQAPNAAVVRENRTVKVPTASGASVRVEGVTVTSNPGTLADAVYVAVVLPTFLTRRSTVWMPGRLPIAIEA